MILTELFDKGRKPEIVVHQDDAERYNVEIKSGTNNKLRTEIDINRTKVPGDWELFFRTNGEGGGAKENHVGDVVDFIDVLKRFVRKHKPNSMWIISDKGAAKPFAKIAGRALPGFKSIVWTDDSNDEHVYMYKKAPELQETGSQTGFMICDRFIGYKKNGSESVALAKIPEGQRKDLKPFLKTAKAAVDKAAK